SDKKLSFNTHEVFDIDSDEKLIVSLPFAREIATYHNNDDKFIQYFHLIRGTKRKSLLSLRKLIEKNYKNAKIVNVSNASNFLNRVFDLCKIYSGQTFGSYDISKKVILALGIRLKFESILIKGDISI